MLHSTISQEMIGDDAIGPWMVYKNINLNGYKVSIDGHGPDELMGGYDEYRNLSFLGTSTQSLEELIISIIIRK